MQLKRISLKNFRNFPNVSVEFGSRVNVIWGPNAQGKTSILEAIYLLTVGRSFRTTRVQDLIKFHTEAFHVDAEFCRNGVDQTLSFGSNGKEKKILYNQNPCPSIASLLELLQCVVVAPDDNLISGPPQSRRFFLDLHISQMDPLYLNHLTRYQKALKQRNFMLKEEKLAGIEVWEQQMAIAAEFIHHKRSQTLDELSIKLKQIYPELSGESEDLNLHYRAKCAPEDYLKVFEENREKETILGSTLVGPHRDELKVTIGHDDSRKFASEGQKRTCVIAMRLAIWEKLKECSQEPPLMLIDDLGANLDQSRRSRLIEKVESLGQVFITSTLDPGQKGSLRSIQLPL